MLPFGKIKIFHNAAFFKKHTPLPTPAEVREEAAEQSSQPEIARNVLSQRKGTIRFPAMGLLVKTGERSNIAEGQCLWVLREYLNDKVNVPEIYGRQIDGGQTFIYMELLEGSTLEDKWDDLTTEDKDDIYCQLRDMIRHWQTLEQDPSDRFIGRIDSGALLDRHFHHYATPKNPAGPFDDVASFHDWFASVKHTADSPPRSPDEFRTDLADDVSIVFTHRDLHPSNIMLTPVATEDEATPQRRYRVSVIDWHQSGWYPQPWEACKARYSVSPEGEWFTHYLSKLFWRTSETYEAAWE